MSESVYDRNAAFYLDFVDRSLADPNGLPGLLTARIAETLGPKIKGAIVCDIACGEGYLSRAIAALGARQVVGVDLSPALVDIARQRAESPGLAYRVDDAQTLATFEDASVDVAVSQMAMMDIPDAGAMFRSVRRVLRPGAVFGFSLLHPCFESPFTHPGRPQFELDTNGAPAVYLIRRYATEGYWQSGGAGVRGHMGAYHRTLSTYMNELIGCGFRIDRLEEPVSAEGAGLFAEVPRALIVFATRMP